MGQRFGPILASEAGQKILETGEHRQPLPPTLHAVPGAEIQAGGKGSQGVVSFIHQRNRRLGHDQRETALQADRQPLALVFHRIVPRCDIDIYIIVAHLHREVGCVVRPQIKRAAGAEIEAGVMPMAGKNSILDTAPVEGEAHMRAAIVERVDFAFVMDEDDDVAV